MKTMIQTLIAGAALALSVNASAFITGDVTGGGSFSGSVTSADAWVLSNPSDGDMVNFWTLTGMAGDSVSVTVTSSATEFGVSLYEGTVTDFELLVPGFNNSGDFADNNFVAGTPLFGAAGTELLDIILPNSGTYTIAVGGEGFGFAPSFAYDMDVSVAPVPVPAAVWLLGSALFGLFGLRQRKA